METVTPLQGEGSQPDRSAKGVRSSRGYGTSSEEPESSATALLCCGIGWRARWIEKVHAGFGPAGAGQAPPGNRWEAPLPTGISLLGVRENCWKRKSNRW